MQIFWVWQWSAKAAPVGSAIQGAKVTIEKMVAMVGEGCAGWLKSKRRIDLCEPIRRAPL
ncbi:MAG: hypothetical protein ACREA2_02615 [Blastocatellia bacterium]